MSLKRLGKALRRKGEQSEEVASSLVSTEREDFSPFPMDSSRSKVQGKPGSLSTDHSDEALPEEVEITEGGWVCQVERFVKRIDSRGRIRYCHDREEKSSPIANQDLIDPKKPQILGKNKAEKAFQQSIISCFSHTRMDFGDLTDPAIYIEIKSPLILEVLRKNARYDQKVWPYETCRFQGGACHWREDMLILSDSLSAPTKSLFMSLISSCGINIMHWRRTLRMRATPGITAPI